MIFKIKCNLRTDSNEYVADKDEFIYLPCPISSVNNIIGTIVYKCKSDGKFHYINSTCDEVPSRLQKEVSKLIIHKI